MPRLRPRLVFLSLLLLVVCKSAGHAQDPASEEFFEKRVRPVLAGTCFRCHGGLKEGGSLRVDSRESLLKGGDSGSAIDHADPKKSLLLAAIRRDDDVSAMPPDKPLTAAEIADITNWVEAGAPWPVQAAKFASAPHWAFQPLVGHQASPLSHGDWPRTSVDSFLLTALHKAGKQPSPQADRRTLLRRLSYDLTGLPPKPDEVIAFENSAATDVYENIVDRLLASPAYGEHWGRQWLDVVRYADTAGENSDHPLPHAWRYRNWVIDALNRDLPYDEFIREQVAGDLLAQQGPANLAEQRVIATGYLSVARRFGHAIEKDMHLTLEDTLDTLGKSVLGLSIGCCRCHDHKFDPLSVEDYYGLYGIFESTKFPFPGCEPEQQPRDLVALPLSPEAIARSKDIDQQIANLDSEASAVTTTQAAASQKLQTASAQSIVTLAQGELDDGGAATFDGSQGESLAKLSIQRGQALQLSIAPRGNHGADTALVEFEIVENSGKQRTWSVSQLIDDFAAGNPHADLHGNDGVWAFLDLQATPQLLGERLLTAEGRPELQAWRSGDTPVVLVNRAELPTKVWTELPPRAFFMHPGPQGPVGMAWISPIDGEVSIRGRIADAHPSGPDGISWRLDKIGSPEFGEAIGELGMVREKASELSRRKAALLATRPSAELAYAVAEGVAHHARIHKRGEPTELGDEAPRKFLDALGGFPVKNVSSSGRLELADWLVSTQNPLPPRVIANRLWQGHFGRGLVTTPNDFGTRGAEPTHPELLDHLASELIRSGWSLKSLHRRIVLSAAYQQAAGDADAASIYAAFKRRRLTAEELRDTLLAAGGDLDLTPGGPHPFPAQASWSFTQHAPFAADYDTQKRSVYVMQKRNRRHRFFALFDGADPNSSTPLREVTTVPTQALYFLNDPLLHSQAANLAARTVSSSGSEPERLTFMYLQLLGRQPTEQDRSDAADFLRQYLLVVADRPEAERESLVWQAYARVLLSSSEVLHVE
jgi:hypothetical protein